MCRQFILVFSESESNPILLLLGGKTVPFYFLKITFDPALSRKRHCFLIWSCFVFQPQLPIDKCKHAEILIILQILHILSILPFFWNASLEGLMRIDLLGLSSSLQLLRITSPSSVNSMCACTIMCVHN